MLLGKVMEDRLRPALPSKGSYPMKHEPIQRREALGRESLAGDFGLIFKAIADAFRGMGSRSRLESRWSQLRYGGCC